jgi:ABC-type protease/lipase transport system fused ATPase/permease subunit
VVVITHRTNLLGIADLMLLLMGGEVKLFGPAKEVLATLKKPPQPQAPTRAAVPGNTLAIRA